MYKQLKKMERFEEVGKMVENVPRGNHKKTMKQ